MNKIDEIPLRVAAEIGAVSYSPPPFRAVRGYSFTYDDLWRFTRALVADPELLAELRKDAAPVIASEQKPVAWVDVIDRHEGPYNFNGLELLDSGKHLLFTSPPNTADIEQRVAEACEQGKRDAVPEDTSKGFHLWFDREAWGNIIDGLMLERERSLQRKSSNPESNSNGIADRCAELIAAIRDKAAAAPRQEK